MSRERVSAALRGRWCPHHCRSRTDGAPQRQHALVGAAAALPSAAVLPPGPLPRSAPLPSAYPLPALWLASAPAWEHASSLSNTTACSPATASARPSTAWSSRRNHRPACSGAPCAYRWRSCERTLPSSNPVRARGHPTKPASSAAAPPVRVGRLQGGAPALAGNRRARRAS